MSFEDKIINNSKVKEKNLLRACKIAKVKPDTGVTINVKSAYFVIRDCADITHKYLPLLCYGSYPDPFATLKGKILEKEIIDFVARAQKPTNTHAKHLLYAIFSDIAKKENKPLTPVASAPVQITEQDEADVDDIYGDYDYDPDSVSEATPVEANVVSDIDLTDGKSMIDKLITVFDAVRDK